MEPELFYWIGGALTLAALVVSAVGLRSDKFPPNNKALFGLIAVFAFLVVGSTTYAVVNARDEQEKHLAELEEEQDEAVAHAIEAHHNEVEPKTVEAVLVQAADALSGARPGARGESLEQYVTRLRDLEEIGQRHPGVNKVFAVRAGREIRVMVDPGVVDDETASMIAHEIATAVEKEMEYPGRIKITVIRESRSTSYAS